MDVNQAKELMAAWIEQSEAALLQADIDLENGDPGINLDRVAATRLAVKAAKLAVKSNDLDVFTFGYACWQIRAIQTFGHSKAVIAGIDVAIQIAETADDLEQRQIENN